LQTRQVVALVTVIALIALALGTTIGYGISSAKTTTLTTTQTQTITSYGIPQGLETVTKLVMISHVGDLTMVVCGTSTFPAGVLNIVDSTTTEYIFPPTNNSTSQGRFLNVTMTTLTSSGTVLNPFFLHSKTNVTTITVSPTSDNTTVCPVIP